jgi:hypothetical protein
MLNLLCHKRPHHCSRAIRSLLCIAFAFILLFPVATFADEFGIMVVPSLMDADMDAWYRIPSNSGPLIHDAPDVTVGQPFNLLVFFRGYATDEKNQAHMTYDVQVYGPDGKPTDDNGSGIVAYQGPVTNKENILLNQQFLKIIFTEKYPLGTYKIKVTAYDKVGNHTAAGENSLPLKAFSSGVEFDSEEMFSKWLMHYHERPEPCRVVNAITQFVSLDTEWPAGHVGILAFFRRVLVENQFLMDNLSSNFKGFSVEEQKKLLLVLHLAGYDKTAALAKAYPQLEKFYPTLRTLQIPATDGDITTGDQLDILWSEFLATGRYAPVKKIVETLALYKFKGTLEKIKSGEIKEKTDQVIGESFLDATYQAAAWSLVSNCRQVPLVFKYCVTIYEKEPLDDAVKQQLRAVLAVAQKDGSKK